MGPPRGFAGRREADRETRVNETRFRYYRIVVGRRVDLWASHRTPGVRWSAGRRRFAVLAAGLPLPRGIVAEPLRDRRGSPQDQLAVLGDRLVAHVEDGACDADAGDDVSRRVVDRNRYAADPDAALLVVQGVTLLPDADQVRRQRTRLEQRTVGETRKLGAVQEPRQRGLVQIGQQHLAERRGVGRMPASDLAENAERAACLLDRDVDDVEAVEHGEAHGLVGGFGQLAKMGSGDLVQLEIGKVAVSEIQYARPQPVAVALTQHDAVELQRAQDAQQRRLADVVVGGQLLEPARLGAGREVEQDPHGTREDLHDVLVVVGGVGHLRAYLSSRSDTGAGVTLH